MNKIKIHELKIWPKFYKEVQSGRKRAEVRMNDRDFKTGDILRLKEWKPRDKSYTGREIFVEVTHMTWLSDFTENEEGFVVLSIDQNRKLGKGK